MTEPNDHGRRRRVLFIGLDAGDAELITGWCDQGYLPNIEKMRADGIWVPMRTTADTVHVSAWPSIFTGAAPDHHGLYHAYVMRSGHQAPVRPRPEACPVPFFWRQLSDHGRRAVIMDAFMTCPLREFAGAQIAEWGTWSWFTEPSILPASLGPRIRERFGAYPGDDHSKVGMVPLPDPAGFHDRLLAAVAKKTEVVTWLMADQDWDLFLVVFGEVHGAGHYLWHYHDADYPSHPGASGGQLRCALRDVYVAIDRAIGQLRAQVDDDTTVLVVSGDGMGPNYSGSHILPGLLRRLGLSDQGRADPTGEGPARRRGLVSTLRGLVPREVRFAISRHLFPRWLNERLSLMWKVADISWKDTRAFLIDNANEGYVRINLKGREPAGVVAPGVEYQAVCDQIRRVAATMVCPVTGERAASAVHLTDDLYDGPCRDSMPDVIVLWNPEARVTTELLTEELGLIRSANAGHQVAPFYTGNHRPNAFTLAVGPGVAPGGAPADASTLDLAPTLLDHFDVAPPAHMRGRVLDLLAGRAPTEG